MKRLVAIAAFLLVLGPFVHADSSDEQYVQIYNLIQEGDSLSANQPRQALEKYNEAQTELRRFQRVYPGWDDRVVNFRLDYLASKITILSATIAGVSNAAPAAASSPASTTAGATSPPAAVAPANPPVAAPAPAQAPVATAPPQPSPEVTGLQNQISGLQNELGQIQKEKSLLQAKLREALAARPAGADPRAFALAQEKIRSVEKENELLQVSLAQEKDKVSALANSAELEKTKLELADAKRRLADQTARATRLEEQNESLQAQVKTLTAGTAELAELRSENAALKKSSEGTLPAASAAAPQDLSRKLAQAQATIAALQADKEVWSLEKAALQNRVKQLSEVPAGPVPTTQVWTENTQHVKQLERERDELQKKLNAAQKELYGRKAKTTASRVDELANELETLRARLDIYESKPVPYTAEELALFKRPETAVANPHEGEKSARELPAGTVQLVAEAQQDFSARSYEAAEKKYLEVLKRDDKNVNTLANLATIQLEMGHFDDAEKNLKTALSVEPDDAFSLSILGNLRFRQGKYDEALDALSRAAKADPQNAEIQNFLGLTLSQKGMRKAAETAFRKAIMLNPNYAGAQNNLAVFYLTAQPPEVALARWHYEKAIAAGFPHNPDLEKMLNEKKTASDQ